MSAESLRDEIVAAMRTELDNSDADFAAADAVLAVPRVAAALRVLDAVEGFALSPIEGDRTANDWFGRGNNAVVNFLRGVAVGGRLV